MCSYNCDEPVNISVNIKQLHLQFLIQRVMERSNRKETRNSETFTEAVLRMHSRFNELHFLAMCSYFSVGS